MIVALKCEYVAIDSFCPTWLLNRWAFFKKKNSTTLSYDADLRFSSSLSKSAVPDIFLINSPIRELDKNITVLFFSSWLISYLGWDKTMLTAYCKKKKKKEKEIWKRLLCSYLECLVIHISKLKAISFFPVSQEESFSFLEQKASLNYCSQEKRDKMNWKNVSKVILFFSRKLMRNRC